MAATPLEMGTLVQERYKIEKIIGQGGMGTVYLAHHVRLDSPMAVKELRAEYPTEKERQAALRQFEAEARFLVRLNHPNLPKVTDAFIENDRCYMVMEYIEGVTLDNLLREAGGGPMDILQVVEWGLQIADVLAYLHSQTPAVIFRDLKPGNIMVQPDGNVRLIDFGIARRFQPGAAKDTALFGSVGYSPPEQFGLRQTDPRADIYSFGATLHHLLTGRDPLAQPFKFPPAITLNPAIPESLSRLIEACLAIDADKRPVGIHEVALNLLAIRDDLAARPPKAAPLLGDAPASTPPNEAPSGSKSGPRIISTKLAEAEAQRRRESGKRAPASNTVTPTRVETDPILRWAVIAACLVLLLGGTTLAVVLSRSARARQVRPPAPTNPPANNVNVAVPPVSPPPTLLETDIASPNQDAGTVEFDKPIGQEIVTDSQGNATLRLRVAGRIHGEANQSGNLGVFFYDGDGNPLLARDPKSSYAHDKTGQLVSAHSLLIDSDDKPFVVTMTVPMSAFPTDTPPSVKFRCRAFIAHRSVGATDLVALNPVFVQASLPNTAPEPGPNAPPPGGAAVTGGESSGNRIGHIRGSRETVGTMR
jgi:serine/threonine-protein kinase